MRVLAHHVATTFQCRQEASVDPHRRPTSTDGSLKIKATERRGVPKRNHHTRRGQHCECDSTSEASRAVQEKGDEWAERAHLHAAPNNEHCQSTFSILQNATTSDGVVEQLVTSR
ncbi:unnamed protein product [Prorocentrum cordatum]|uniref:Uncharacterized protein n=1 Tax=Prorocentrum cordatum TaxID=2364126 RepID=A0ABN9WHU9_9DINO|nr:unnamed protein product [Polarella glacialis]